MDLFNRKLVKELKETIIDLKGKLNLGTTRNLEKTKEITRLKEENENYFNRNKELTEMNERACERNRELEVKILELEGTKNIIELKDKDVEVVKPKKRGRPRKQK